MIFSFILILLSVKTALQVFKTMLSEENFMGQIIHKVEVVQFQVIKKVSTWLKSLWSNIENLLKSIVWLKFSTSSENHINMIRKWQWNGKECTVTVTVIMDLNEYKHTMSSILTHCV